MTEVPPGPVQQPSPAVPPATTEDPLTAQKEVEFYAATVNAWYATTLEHDKSLFVLAGGGIGIMISLLTTVGFDSYWILALFLAAIFCFLNCLAYLLRIFEGNRHYLEAIVGGSHHDADANLKRWDKVAKNSFLFGVIFSAAVALAVSALKISSKQTEQKQMTSANQTPSAHGATLDSAQGAAKLQPLGKSFQGAANMAPAAPAAAASQSAAATASAPAQPVARAAQASAPATPTAPTPATKP